MNKTLRFSLLSMLMMLCGTVFAGSIVFGDLGLENGVQYSDPFDGDDFTVTFAGGGNDGKYYNTGNGIRVYGGGTITIAAKSGTLTAITFAFDGSNKPASADVVSEGTYDVETGVWTGNAESVVFTRPTGSGHWRVQSIEATVENGGVVETKAAKPVFNPKGGNFYESVTVTLSHSNADAKIYYTTGDDMEAAVEYTEPIVLTETATVKAYAVDESCDITMSEVVEETYTINAITYTSVADALTVIEGLADGAKTESDYFVQGYIISISSIDTGSYGNATFVIADTKDAEEGLTVYRAYSLNNQMFTSEDEIAVGDQIVVFGKLQKYVKNSVVTPEIAQGCYIYEITEKAPVVEPANVYSIAGSLESLFGATWDPAATATEMALNQETGLYEWSVADVELAAGSIEFKVVVNHAWDEAYPSENFVLDIESDGIYTVAITFNEETKDIVATATKTADIVIPTVYSIAGTDNLFGIAWDPSNTATEMVLNQETGLYEWSAANVELAAGYIEFKVVENHSWEVAYPENNWVLDIAEDGVYNVTITFNEETKEITATAEKVVLPTFNFNTFDHAVSATSTHDGDITEDEVFTAEGITMTITPSSTSTPNRFWGTNNGPQLRMYSGTMTIVAPEGKVIVKAVIDAAKWNANNTFNGEAAETAEWEGNADTLVLAIAGNTQMDSVDLTLADKSETPTGIQTVNAEKANAIYNLNGQQVVKAQKGLYIVNGKKIVVK
jgi:hypothetical protein